MARSDEGMSTATKVVLAILGVGCLFALVACGGAAWWWMRAVDDFQQGIADSIQQDLGDAIAEGGAAGADAENLNEMYALDPGGIAKLTESIIEIQIPPRYEPDAGEDFSSAGILRRQVHYHSSDHLGNIVIREMLKDDVTTREAAAQTLADELKSDSWIYELESASSSQRTFTIGGEECLFEFQAGNDPVHGVAMGQAFGAVPSGGGIAYVLLKDDADHWDEAAIVAILESIRVGRPLPAPESPSTDTSTDTTTDAPPTESTGEPPAATPGA